MPGFVLCLDARPLNYYAIEPESESLCCSGTYTPGVEMGSKEYIRSWFNWGCLLGRKGSQKVWAE